MLLARAIRKKSRAARAKRKTKGVLHEAGGATFQLRDEYDRFIIVDARGQEFTGAVDVGRL